MTGRAGCSVLSMPPKGNKVHRAGALLSAGGDRHEVRKGCKYGVYLEALELHEGSLPLLFAQVTKNHEADECC